MPRTYWGAERTATTGGSGLRRMVSREFARHNNRLQRTPFHAAAEPER